MPRLETSEQKNDFISKLGTKLPTPYIGKITIVSDATNSFNEETSDGIEVEVSVYLPAISYAKPTSLVNQIKKTNIIVGFIIGNREIDEALNTYASDSVIFNHLYKVDSADTETISDEMLFIPMSDHEDLDSGELGQVQLFFFVIFWGVALCAQRRPSRPASRPSPRIDKAIGPPSPASKNWPSALAQK